MFFTTFTVLLLLRPPHRPPHRRQLKLHQRPRHHPHRASSSLVLQIDVVQQNWKHENYVVKFVAAALTVPCLANGATVCTKTSVTPSPRGFTTTPFKAVSGIDVHHWTPSLEKFTPVHSVPNLVECGLTRALP